MATTRKREIDLEAEVIARCVRAMKLTQLRGYVRSRRYVRELGQTERARVLRYLAMRFGITLGLLLLAVPVAAQSPRTAKLMTVLSTSAQAADVVTTLKADSWQTREVNVLVPRTPAKLIAVKASVALFNAIGSTKAARRHPKLVFWIQTGLGAGFTAVAARNWRVR